MGGNKRFTKEEFINRAKTVHGNKYDYSNVIYNGSKVKVEIICPIHGSFLQQPSMHIVGRGCPKCGKEKLKTNREVATKTFIEKAQKIHNGYYSYKKSIYLSNREYVTITCPIHGDFSQIAQSHLIGCGCAKCANEGRRMSADKFIERANSVHKNKYTYERCNFITVAHKVTVTCPQHGDFLQNAAAHLRGQGCPICSRINYALSKRTDINEMIESFRKVHGDTYDYSLINDSSYVNYKTPLPIICKQHGIFYQKPINHIKGYGCHQCKCSLGEKKIKELLDKSDIEYIQQYKILINDLFCKNKKMFVDFYIQSKNTIIEFNGAQHYTSVDYFGGQKIYEKQILRDEYLKSYCKEHKIKLIEIPYSKYGEIEEILKQNKIIKLP